MNRLSNTCSAYVRTLWTEPSTTQWHTVNTQIRHWQCTRFKHGRRTLYTLYSLDGGFSPYLHLYPILEDYVEVRDVKFHVSIFVFASLKGFEQKWQSEQRLIFPSRTVHRNYIFNLVLGEIPRHWVVCFPFNDSSQELMNTNLLWHKLSRQCTWLPKLRVVWKQVGMVLVKEHKKQQRHAVSRT